MASISGLGNSYNAYQTQQSGRQARMQERMFQKVDADQSGGVDATELQTLMDKVAEKTGATLDTSAADLLSSADTNSDGSLSSDELGAAMQSVLPPPPSTMEFAQSRSGGPGAGGKADDLFGKVDADGSGNLSETELQSLMDQMASDRPDGSGEASSAADLISQYDADGDGELSETEFSASRPSGRPQDMQGMQGMPPPPPGGMAGASGATGTSGASGTSETSETYDAADLNQDGTVSAQEQAIADAKDAIQQLFNAADANSDEQLTKAELSDFLQQLADQYSQVANGGVSTSSGSTVNTVA